jgi:hypothetical protein
VRIRSQSSSRAQRVRTDYEQFVSASSDALLRTAYLVVWEAAEAEDLVQDCLLAVARRWPRVRGMVHPDAYARRVLINLALDGASLRTRRREELAANGSGTVAELPDDGDAYSFVEGHAGAGVTAATLILSDGSQVQTTIQNGWLVAWWPGPAAVTSARVSTASGTTAQHFDSQPSGNCPEPPAGIATPKDVACASAAFAGQGQGQAAGSMSMLGR